MESNDYWIQFICRALHIKFYFLLNPLKHPSSLPENIFIQYLHIYVPNKLVAYVNMGWQIENCQ